MIVFFRTQDHLIQDDGQLEPAWGATKTWPAMFMLVVAAISAGLSIGPSPPSPYPSPRVPSIQGTHLPAARVIFDRF